MWSFHNGCLHPLIDDIQFRKRGLLFNPKDSSILNIFFLSPFPAIPVQSNFEY
jgi:hypothetical protein